MASKSLSIIIAVHNDAALAARQIRSASSLNSDRVEIVVVCDRCDHSNSSIIRSLKKRYSNVVWLNTHQHGLHGTYNTGITSAIGEYAYLAGADDNLRPSYFLKLLDILEQHKPDLVLSPVYLAYYTTVTFSGVTRVEPVYNRDKFSINILTDKQIRDLFLSNISYFSGGGTIFRRSLLIDVGCYRKSLGQYADIFAQHAAISNGGTVILYDNICSVVSVKPTSWNVVQSRSYKCTLRSGVEYLKEIHKLRQHSVRSLPFTVLGRITYIDLPFYLHNRWIRDYYSLKYLFTKQFLVGVIALISSLFGF